MDDKLTQLKIFVEQNIQKVHDRQKTKFKEMDDYQFKNDQKMDICLGVVDDVEITKKAQKELQAFAELYNKDLIHQLSKHRKEIFLKTADLQLQISSHEKFVTKYKPRINTMEEKLKEHGQSLVEMHNIENSFDKQIKQLIEFKVNTKDYDDRNLELD